jgi:UDP-N-acetyl-D-mannosaminuronic acid transferase (WecB/TagA/CpsF family)
MAQTARGGLIVVPSAPVLVGLTDDPAHREAIETSDLAITDSSFMVLLWTILKRERLIRISGLRYLRALLDWPEFRQPGATFWIMPSHRDEIGNRAWLAEQGMTVNAADCYLAPAYARRGPLEDPALLALIQTRRPRFVMINLGGGVQERLGYYLKQALAKAGSEGQGAGSWELGAGRPELEARSSELIARNSQPSSGSAPGADRASAPITPNSEPITNNRAERAPPALICTGAAIAFLSNRQVNIPPWADRMFLGWLMRSLSEPKKFLPRYWHSLRLAALLWKHGSRSVAS